MIRCINLLFNGTAEVECTSLLEPATEHELRSKIAAIEGVARLLPQGNRQVTRIIVRPVARLKASALVSRLTQELEPQLSANALWFTATLAQPLVGPRLVPAHGFAFLEPTDDAMLAYIVKRLEPRIPRIYPSAGVAYAKDQILVITTGVATQEAATTGLSFKEILAELGINLCHLVAVAQLPGKPHDIDSVVRQMRNYAADK